MNKTSNRKKISFVFGTRPELIKLAPLIEACKECFELQIVSTGQHRELLDNLYSWFGFCPDEDLQVMTKNQSPGQVIASILSKIERPIAGSDLLIVQGDTATAFAGAMGAFLQKIPVAHLEAGLRTQDIYNPFPEEMFRRQISQLASLHFAPTKAAAANLANDGIKDNVYVLGNTVVDALKNTIRRLKQLEQDEAKFAAHVKLPFIKELTGKRVLLVTMHRRENLGQDHEQVALALKQIVSEFSDCLVVFPVHPNPAVRKTIEPILQNNLQVKLLEPVDYVTFCWLLQKAYVLVTDSGGLQEEGAALGKPTLILRQTTERPEAVEAGVAKLVGSNYDAVLTSIRQLLSDENLYQTMATATDAFGEGNSAAAIVKKLSTFLL